MLAICDGRTIMTLPPAQDHKPAFDNDTGPNTGGMGAYCPTNAIDGETLAWVEENVLVPTVHWMKRTRMPFTGILYAGLMMTTSGPRVIEYNVRFGDPRMPGDSNAAKNRHRRHHASHNCRRPGGLG